MTITEGLVAAAATLVIVNQVRGLRAAMELRRTAIELKEYVRKVQEEAVRVLGLMREATYQAQQAAHLREDLRIAREVPEEIAAPLPSLRPRTPAQKAKAARAARARGGNA